ncbi:hypothetical protein F4604DRAFT_1923751 [Suillus subluteus]|nr:hypothetical protein F4604DRAFT_1923751 [Suillus subluteus]
MNSFIQDSAIDLSLDLQQHYAHLLVFPQCYDSFIPAPHLPISALLDFTNLPPFDHSLTVADLHRFFTSEHCVTNDVPADFLDRSLPPLSLSTQLLNTFSQAYHDGVKSVKDPRFLGNLPFWVVQYWHDLGCAIAAKEHWSLARDWLSGQRENADTDLAAAIDEVFSSLWVLGWGTTLRGPAAALQVLDLAEFLSSTPMKGRFIDVMVNEISLRIPLNPQLCQTTIVESDGVDDEAPLEVVLEHIMSDKTYVPEGYIMGTDGSLIVDGAADKHCDMISPSDSEGIEEAGRGK